ncbi:Pentatricopeptide repeat-containing protein, mitochondrial [Ananas comosus]|uniref:Pentatricopeptide repeat-containing protein, mitochondrial n=1 Tax=Ananas comosus TaxID=4615 RepID=A0A199VMU2_ANACO|nr:Pentatricopeptide repeat-containing protein, mitochondrial [Ananas comosus]
MLSLSLRRTSRNLIPQTLIPSIPPASFVFFLLLHRSPLSSSAPDRGRARRRRPAKPPPIDETLVERALASLPARFTGADLAAALYAEPDPRVSLRVLTHALHLHPHRLLRPRPDPAPFLAALKKLASARLLPELDSLASLALSLPGPPAPLLNALVYFYCDLRKLGKAVHVYTRMRASPDPAARPTAHTYALLFTALLARGGADSYVRHAYTDVVRALFRQMVDAGIEPDIVALNALVRGYAESLHLNDALRVFHQMGRVYRCEPDEHTYSHLVRGLCAQGRTRNARELFDEMRAKGLAPTARACDALVSALAMDGEVGDAARAVREAARAGRAVDGITWRALLGEMCRRKRTGDAAAMLREMAESGALDRRMRRELLRWVEEEFGDDDDDDDDDDDGVLELRRELRDEK